MPQTMSSIEAILKSEGFSCKVIATDEDGYEHEYKFEKNGNTIIFYEDREGSVFVDGSAPNIAY